MGFKPKMSFTVSVIIFSSVAVSIAPVFLSVSSSVITPFKTKSQVSQDILAKLPPCLFQTELQQIHAQIHRQPVIQIQRVIRLDLQALRFPVRLRYFKYLHRDRLIGAARHLQAPTSRFSSSWVQTEGMAVCFLAFTMGIFAARSSLNTLFGI